MTIPAMQTNPNAREAHILTCTRNSTTQLLVTKDQEAPTVDDLLMQCDPDPMPPASGSSVEVLLPIGHKNVCPCNLPPFF